MLLYHTGFQEIAYPDVHFGRKNADFGQGFYTADDEEFAVRWAREKRGEDTILNTYELDLEELQILRLQRDEDWFRYIFDNRRAKEDAHSEADVVIGPIANDTIYDTLGIFTSGILSDEMALKLLLIGPEYRQIVLKTEKAASQLRFISSRILKNEEIRQFRGIVAAEEAAYQQELAEEMEML